MSYRCINAFEFAGAIYPGGVLVEDDDTILATHGSFFARVDLPPGSATETATAGPAEPRAIPNPTPAKKAAPAKKAVHHAVKSGHNPEEGK